MTESYQPRPAQPDTAPSSQPNSSLSHGVQSSFQNRQPLPIINVAAVLVTLVTAYLVNPYSIVMYGYYMLLWCAFIYVLHRPQMKDFLTAFLINSAAIGIFYVVQTHFYPESFGTTSPLGSWTDDSFFFSLVADSVPPGLELRRDYFLYTMTFSSIVDALTVLPIHHPMDVIFFQSGVAALLATFTKRFAFQMSGDHRIARVAYILCIVCPFLMMNGGVVFIRDTFVAALMIYSLACLFDRRYILAGSALLLQLVIRPGTGLILLPACAIIYLADRKILGPKNLFVLAAAVPLVIIAFSQLGIVEQYFPAYAGYINSMSLTGRELFADLSSTDANAIFREVQEYPFFIRFFLNGIYIFFYPFLDPIDSLSTAYFDSRSVTLGLIVPIYSFWLNAWFIAGVITKSRVLLKHWQITAAVIVTLLLVGTYSLQTRHKTIVYPLYYVIAAVGFASARPGERRVGYLASFAIIGAQLIVVFR
ncbi:MAG: hypothetical protein Q8R45_01280 [Brevundimonas sp.]|uniref:hypothetical protein n=1 Tax=Brevundimonas sp. TaxID=1871086 RepID=UPI002734FBD7|nr:hypothetical protein [Brevundimonas sp.]MDP3655584.1 hypothetical protein [Brevundimonas sp.]MDZ4110655.1 hypothetical protein [Brevundimonas sp.]